MAKKNSGNFYSGSHAQQDWEVAAEERRAAQAALDGTIEEKRQQNAMQQILNLQQQYAQQPKPKRTWTKRQQSESDAVEDHPLFRPLQPR